MSPTPNPAGYGDKSILLLDKDTEVVVFLSGRVSAFRIGRVISSINPKIALVYEKGAFYFLSGDPNLSVGESDTRVKETFRKLGGEVVFKEDNICWEFADDKSKFVIHMKLGTQ